MTEKVEVTCPHCGSTQKEAPAAVSTYCRKCGQYFKLDRKAPGSKSGVFSLRKQPREETPKASAPAPRMPLQIAGFGEQGELRAEARPEEARRPAAEKQGMREVVCFECQRVHKVAPASTSSLCPQCGCYIDLRDVVVKDKSPQRIRTRGDVLVEKKAALLCTNITCGNLTVLGQVSGSVNASGEVIFRTSGKVLGEVRCKRLVVEKKSEIQFLQPIHAESAEVHGQTTGQYHCSERLLIGKHGSVHGLVDVKRCKVELGGQLSGEVRIDPRDKKEKE